jgi:surface antigen
MKRIASDLLITALLCVSKQERAYGRACREADGNWRVQQ